MEDYGAYGTIFRAIRPAYFLIFDVIHTNFDLKANPDGGLFRTTQAGLHFREEDVLASNMFPWAFLELGNVTSTEPRRAPNVFGYEVTFQLVVMTFADLGNQDRLVFNKDVGNTGQSVNKNPGYGDLIERVMGYLWQYYHKNRFGIREEDYTIYDWKITGVGTPNIAHLQMMLLHPYIRARQINITCQVDERS